MILATVASSSWPSLTVHIAAPALLPKWPPLPLVREQKIQEVDVGCFHGGESIYRVTCFEGYPTQLAPSYQTGEIDKVDYTMPKRS